MIPKLIHRVGYEREMDAEKASLLAAELNFTVDKEATACVFITSEKIVLKLPSFSPLCADFAEATWSKRKSEGKKQGLVRAVKPAKGLKIIDATAGWGRDAAVLASFGAKVLMLERHPVMAVLLADALLQQTEADREQLNLSLAAISAYEYLDHLSESDYPDVIYIDPMHPERSKSALVKKELQVLQQMIGVDHDAVALIKLARMRVKQRVVVKWPQKTDSLLPASFSVEGKTVRFDVYLP